MKELKIRMHPPICKHILEAANFDDFDDDQLKELILSEIKIHLIDIMNPNSKTSIDLNELKEKFSQVKHSQKNSVERKDWANDYGVFYKVLIPDELYNPKVNFLEMEIEEIPGKITINIMIPTYKKVQLIHKEPGEECFEILKSAIVEDKVLKKFRIDQHTLIAKLPEKVINSFLDFLAQYESDQRKFILQSIKRGAITVKCEEEFYAPTPGKHVKKHQPQKAKVHFSGGN